MRLVDITVYSQYFRFYIEDSETVSEWSSPFGGRYAAVIYDNERSMVRCDCEKGSQCRHTAFVHEVINKESDQSLKGILVSARTASAQTITGETVSRIRGAFAREYNLVNNIIDTRTTRQQNGPLNWMGEVGDKQTMRVIQRTPASFAVYEIGKEQWDLVVGISSPVCQSANCRSSTLCVHVEAVKEAVREWRRSGLMEPAQGGYVSNDQLNMVVDRRYFDAAVMYANRVIADNLRSQLRAALDIGGIEPRVIEDRPSPSTDRSVGGPVTFTTSAAPGTEAKLSPDIDKAIKALDEPKRKKPPKPRSRFTEIDL